MLKNRAQFSFTEGLRTWHIDWPVQNEAGKPATVHVSLVEINNPFVEAMRVDTFRRPCFAAAADLITANKIHFGQIKKEVLNDSH